MTTMTTLEGSTALTVMSVDTEPTATPESVKDEIQKQVKLATKSLQTKLDTVLSSIKNEKEVPRTGASENKKEIRTNKKTVVSTEKVSKKNSKNSDPTLPKKSDLVVEKSNATDVETKPKQPKKSNKKLHNMKKEFTGTKSK